jgi:hypothetical protein
MEVLFEILKYTLPSAIVFLTVYLLMKNFFEQERFKMISVQQKDRYQISLPLKLQAYERLALFLERIRVPVLMMRFPISEMSSAEFCKTLMIGVQQEFEHNMVQQIYVSEKLWEIIVLAKDEVFHAIDEAAQQNKDIEETKHFLLTSANQNASRVIDMALNAIKKEIQLIL